MNRSFVLQAALPAALLGACASLFAFDATASGRMATALAPGDATADAVRASAGVPRDASPWVYLGPQHATVARLALSPMQPERMVALLDSSGTEPLGSMVFTSDEAGERWTPDPYFGAMIQDAVFDADLRSLLAGSFGLWVRGDGDTWWELAMHPEHGYALTSERVSVGIDSGNPVWVTALLNDETVVYSLSNDLQTWTDMTPALPPRVLPAEIAVSHNQPWRVAVATIEQPAAALRVFVTNNGGDTWTPSTPPGTFSTISTLRWFGDTLFVGGVATSSGRAQLWSSGNGGASWQLLLESSSSQPHIDVAGTVMQPGLLWVGTGEGVYRSADGGQTFQTPTPDSVVDVHRLEYEHSEHQLWAGRAHEGVWVSGDGGQTWEPRNERLGSLPAVDVAVNPLDAGEVATLAHGGLNFYGQVSTSTNGGLDWTRNVAPVSGQGRAVRFGPSGLLYATLLGWSDSTLFRRDAQGEWEHIGFERPEGTQLWMGAMNFGATEDTLVVAAMVYDFSLAQFTHRLWRSDNGGQAWQQVLQGQPGSNFDRIERTQGPDGQRLFVLEQSYQPEVTGHVWASDDDGLTWFDATQLLPQGMQQQYCAGANGEVLFVHMENDTYEIQMFRSTDAGSTWARTDWSPGSFFLGTPFTAMHCPGNAQQVFLGGHMGQLWMSHDGGDSVEVQLGNQDTWGDALMESISLSPAGLYVAHLGGVWVNPDIVLPSAGPSNLTVERTSSRMRYRVSLQWQGGAARVDIRRDGAVVATVDNTGQWSTAVLATVQDSTWQVCNAGTDECSAITPEN